MKIAKWNEKAAKILDSMIEKRDLRFRNTDEGVYFANEKGYYAYFLPHVHLSRGNSPMELSSDGLVKTFDAASHDAQLATSDTSGEAIVNSRRVKLRKFENADCEVYAQERFLRVFPKNTFFYISGPTKPIVAGIWEDGQLYVIGIVLPVRVTNFTKSGMEVA